MTVVQILQSLERAGVSLSVEDGDLLLHNASDLDADLLDAVRANKAALLQASAKSGSIPPPSIRPDPAARHEPFPLTDLQQAYLVGRTTGIPLGGIACQAYFEFDLASVDPLRFRTSWN